MIQTTFVTYKPRYAAQMKDWQIQATVLLAGLALLLTVAYAFWPFG
jgi:hypothetical protein